MRPALLNIASAIVTRVDPQTPADAVLRAELKNQRELSPDSSRSISRAVFAYYRWWKWLGNQPVTEQLVQAIELQERFLARPSGFTDEELAAKAVPSWVSEEVTLSSEWLRALQAEPKPWLRARPGHGSELMEKLGCCRPPVPLSSNPQIKRTASPLTPALSPLRGEGERTWRFNDSRRKAGRGILSHPMGEEPGERANPLADTLEYSGEQDLFRTAQFHAGEFEIQDISSQLVGLLCAPQPGETWWDACAGEGGKMLHLADLMQNKGLIWASDRAAWRLQKLKRRAARARVFNYRSAVWEGGPKLPTKTKFDGVLLDAPCSGLGTWQRNPHARWTTTPLDVRELGLLQGQLLAHAAAAVKPGGKLVYAVCTLTRTETLEVVKGFEQKSPEFQPLPMPNLLQPDAPFSTPLWIWPQDCGGNGMFVAAWRKAGHPAKPL